MQLQSGLVRSDPPGVNIESSVRIQFAARPGLCHDAILIGASAGHNLQNSPAPASIVTINRKAERMEKKQGEIGDWEIVPELCES
jgi:hypothetical protein